MIHLQNELRPDMTDDLNSPLRSVNARMHMSCCCTKLRRMVFGDDDSCILYIFSIVKNVSDMYRSSSNVINFNEYVRRGKLQMPKVEM